MRKKVLMFLGAVAVLAVVFSVTAFAESDVLPTDLPQTDYNLIEVVRQSLIMFLTSVFSVVDKIYVFFANLFG